MKKVGKIQEAMLKSLSEVALDNPRFPQPESRLSHAPPNSPTRYRNLEPTILTPGAGERSDIYLDSVDTKSESA